MLIIHSGIRQQKSMLKTTGNGATVWHTDKSLYRARRIEPDRLCPLSFFDLLKARVCLGVLSIVGDQVLIKHIYISIMSFSRKEK